MLYPRVMPRAGHESGMRFGLNAYPLTSSLHELTSYHQRQAISLHTYPLQVRHEVFQLGPNNIFCLMGPSHMRGRLLRNMAACLA